MKKPPRRVILVGPRGAGKSSLAERLAASLGWPLCDLDAEVIQQSGRTIAEWFSSSGEAAFRQYEAEVFAACASMQPLVLATGGGLVLAAENRELLKDLGWIVWLDAPPSELAERLQADANTASQRPALTTERDWAKELAAVRQAREPLYAEVANERLDTQGKTLDELHRILIQKASRVFDLNLAADTAS